MPAKVKHYTLPVNSKNAFAMWKTWLSWFAPAAKGETPRVALKQKKRNQQLLIEAAEETASSCCCSRSRKSSKVKSSKGSKHEAEARQKRAPIYERQKQKNLR